MATGFATLPPPDRVDRTLGEPITIQSELFASTSGICHFEERILDPLLIQGLEDLRASQIKSLESLGLALKERNSSVTSIIVTLDPSTGAPAGSHFATTGLTGIWSPSLSSFVPVSMWKPEFDKIVVTFRFSGHDLGFTAGNSVAPNFTPWHSLGDQQAEFSIYKRTGNKFATVKQESRVAWGLDELLQKFIFRLVLRLNSATDGRFYLQVFILS